MGLGKFKIEIKCCLIFSKKAMKFDVNGVAVARHGLILSQDGAIPSRMVFIRVLGLFNGIRRPHQGLQAAKNVL